VADVALGHLAVVRVGRVAGQHAEALE
jgi:3-deoxy-D-arabino-heptulosonate 7-phosphate (DAHP) synthase class II